MPDSAGEGFPNVGTQKGHEHLHFGDGYIYQYLGGSNGYPLSWYRARGKNVYLQAYSNLNQIPADTNDTLATCEVLSANVDISFDGIGTYTFQKTEKSAKRFAKMKSAEHLTGHVQLGIGNYIRKRIKDYLFG